MEKEKKVQEVLRGQNKRGRFLLASICLENKTFQDVQQKTGWQLRYISERFREALDDLAIAYGLKDKTHA